MEHFEQKKREDKTEIAWSIGYTRNFQIKQSPFVQRFLYKGAFVCFAWLRISCGCVRRDNQ